MNLKYFIISVFVLLVIGGGIWYMSLSKPSEEKQVPISTTTNLPIKTIEPTVKEIQILEQKEPADIQKEVVDSFLGQIKNSNLITLVEIKVDSIYALQAWSDENKGGEALLRYNQSDGWKIISMGGGEWSVAGLMEFGVPQKIAGNLIK